MDGHTQTVAGLRGAGRALQQHCNMLQPSESLLPSGAGDLQQFRRIGAEEGLAGEAILPVADDPGTHHADRGAQGGLARPVQSSAPGTRPSPPLGPFSKKPGMQEHSDGEEGAAAWLGPAAVVRGTRQAPALQVVIPVATRLSMALRVGWS